MSRVLQCLLILSTLGISASAAAQDMPTDALGRYQAIQAKRVERHPYFSKVTLESVSPKDGYELRIQMPDKKGENYSKRAAEKIMPWLEKLESVFVERFVTPNQLTKSRGGAPHVIVILESAGDYNNYLQFRNEACATCRGAVYDPYLGFVVTFEDAFSRRLKAETKRRDLLHAFTHSLQQTYGVGNDRIPGPEWFAEGLGVYFAMIPGEKLEQVGTPHMRAATLKYIVQQQQEGGLSDGSLLPIEKLVAPDGRAEFRKPYGPGRTNDYWTKLEIVSLQCALFIKFLSEGPRETSRANFVPYSKVALRGGGNGPGVVRSNFGELAELEREFWEYLFAEYKKVDPKFKPKIVAVPSEAKTEEASAETVPSSMTKSALELKYTEVEARFAVALKQAAMGRIEVAIQDCATILEEGDDERVQAEHDRMTALLAMRDEYFSYLAESGKKLKVPYQGKLLLSTVDRYEDGTLHLAKNRRGIESVHASELGIADLCSQMSKEKPKFGDAALRLYPGVLANDDRWEKQLSRVDEDNGLAEFAKSELPALRKLGEIAWALNELSELAGAEPSESGANDTLAQIAKLLELGAESELVATRAGALQEASLAAHRVLAAAKPLAELLNGKVEEPSPGRVVVTYDFTDPAHLEDFEHDGKYHRGLRAKLPDLQTDLDKSTCEVRNEKLLMRGQVVLRHKLPFGGEQRVHYVVQFETQNPGSEYYALMVSLCGDGKASGMSNFNFGSLAASHMPSRFYEKADNGPDAIYFGTDYNIALTTDGKRMSCVIDGEDSGSVGVGPLERGSVSLLTHSDALVGLGSFTIEGDVDDADVAQLREAWARDATSRLLGEAGD